MKRRKQIKRFYQWQIQDFINIFSKDTTKLTYMTYGVTKEDYVGNEKDMQVSI
jgi:hypothetical protein